MRKSQRECLYWMSNRLTCGGPHDEGPAPPTPVLLPASLDTSLLHALEDLASNRAVSSACLGLMSSSAMDPATKTLLRAKESWLACLGGIEEIHTSNIQGEKRSPGSNIGVVAEAEVACPSRAYLRSAGEAKCGANPLLHSYILAHEMHMGSRQASWLMSWTYVL